MAERVLITGGAGFIGSHVADHLLRAGYEVRVLDDLVDQVHGPTRRRPAYLDSEVELRLADVRDAGAVRRAVKDVNAVLHLAAAVGVGQSMYQIPRYVDVNAGGTAVLLDALLHHPVRRLVIASSMSVYGEGLYRTADGQAREPGERALDLLRAGRWELEDERGQALTPVPTPETKTPCLASVYALSKFAQERWPSSPAASTGSRWLPCVSSRGRHARVPDWITNVLHLTGDTSPGVGLVRLLALGLSPAEIGARAARAAAELTTSRRPSRPGAAPSICAV
jgi:nucleoside-diphosphate-sugar epimerase